ncbi:iron-sulfur flavoprotein, putative [Trichomonas vaginalis G3]|uniref:Iron-sulfur flavoprotein, putative n=1 Tax=Trichomonas vaginalis (strain ATCC PRA-98 / G3) TaxID=412133 RepID=A2G078_TRIV3|nr:NAD(P)H-dependent FMN-containing OXIDOreductase YWQN-related family [Trichomonas vaginalis G3]EAX89434.1 iron-sulfur flavoprotein, putative [Trichomonas vaginalis G3]KAI5517847.1 NAD(P)H-dependent FMN-containing OXIDOreductase YWQN-related family [Trichomonas vaginalis G3]|eukprot:XP_001302364.1 iron-sulfur flavoprotein [Trichomonas vaginalis G3]
MLSSPQKFAANVLLFNASARNSGNTVTILKAIKEGIESVGKTAEIVHLDKLKFSGCQGCLQCKRPNAPASCIIRDDATKYIDQLKNVDAFVIGSPVYFGNLTGPFYSFYQRALYCHFNYCAEKRSKLTRPVKTGLVYTCGAPQNAFENMYAPQFQHNKDYHEMVFKGKCQVLVNPFQLLAKDVSKLWIPSDPTELKKKWFAEHQEGVLKQAFDMGVSLASE